MEKKYKLSSQEMQKLVINIKEPFAQFLEADKEEFEFQISLLDVVRFAGHACPAMIGAFLISQRAIAELYPESLTLVRGDIKIEINAPVELGATGPISNVFSMIFGAWEKSGFGGLQGNFKRRDLLSYNVKDVPFGNYRFTRIQTGKSIVIAYNASLANIKGEADAATFQEMWRVKIKNIIEDADRVLTVSSI